ncbi:MAG TPA: TRAP transporter small permease [Gemmatimonadaceae bacterium]|nr:TRAP transporter small permease [Gemmatimonadaceae bacterium]
MRALHRALDLVEDAFAVIAGCLLILTVIFVPIDVTSRYFFNAPLTWVFEVTEYILLLVPCLGMAWLARGNGHVAIDIVTSRLPARGKLLFGLASSVAVAAICGFIAWWGARVTFESFQAKAIIENVLQTPQWLVYLWIPVGFGLCAIEFARKAVSAWSGGMPAASG